MTTKWTVCTANHLRLVACLPNVGQMSIKCIDPPLGHAVNTRISENVEFQRNLKLKART